MEKLFETVKLYGKEREEVNISYYLKKNEENRGSCYGIRVAKKSSESGKSVIVSQCEINNMFSDMDDALNFLKLITKNAVTPISLPEIAEEFTVSQLQILTM